MKKSKYSEEQIARILADALSGTKTIREVCKEHGVTDHTFYSGAKSIPECKRMTFATCASSKHKTQLSKES